MTAPIEELAATASTQKNRLAQEKSPYLLQHAENPVDWLPWGEEAFAKARRENKPIFLSIGYSTCHWCHVMAHESFESPRVAAIMNREFVNIKVDREERPDVDRVYMTFVQATTGSGGWPMSVWLTPDLKPFVGGTYFPPEDRHGQPAFTKVLERIAAVWKQDHLRIAEQGTKIVAALMQAQAANASGAGQIGGQAFDSAYQQLAENYDHHEGGFGLAPKFPRPVTLNFLFRHYARARESEIGRHALEMSLFTLRKMAAGGMHDHLGGGFHRYSVDAFWHVPHFEKMLYDQAQLATAYLEAFQLTHDSVFENVARGILNYVRRDMTAKEGGFFSAEDADSLVAQEESGAGGGKTKEGAFYVWTKDEIGTVLGLSADVFNYHYGVHSEGNVPPGADPHGEFTGKNILIELQTIADTARHFAKEEKEVREILARSRALLFEVRAQRSRPHLDDKVITAWNGLMISAYARGTQILGEPAYLQAGLKAATFIRSQLYDQSRRVLFRNYRGGRSHVEGFADDYAFVIQGLLDLYEACFDVNLLQFAIQLQETQDRLFFDQEHGGYFSGTGEDPSILLRMKEESDSAEPAASSIAALNLLRLAQYGGQTKWRERAEQTINAFGVQIEHFPSSMPQMLGALDFSLATPRQIVIAGEGDAKETHALLAEIHAHFAPNKILILANDRSRKFLEERIEAVREMRLLDGKPTAYVCQNFACQEPANSPEALRKLLTTNEHE